MRKAFALGVGAPSLGRLLPRRRRAKAGEPAWTAPPVQTAVRAAGVEWATRRYLLYVVLPLWMASGLVDWELHRRTRIAQTSGTHESLIHALMMSEAGLPVFLGLLFQVNAGLLALMMAAVVVHEATAFWDVAYATGRRDVTPNEQHTHSFLEVVPFMAASFVLCLHWDQLLALAGRGPEPARFALRLKEEPLSPGYLRGILAATVATVVLPYAEELIRCFRADHTLAPHPVTRHVVFTAAPD